MNGVGVAVVRLSVVTNTCKHTYINSLTRTPAYRQRFSSYELKRYINVMMVMIIIIIIMVGVPEVGDKN